MTKVRALILGGIFLESESECDKLVEAISVNKETNLMLGEIDLSMVAGKKDEFWSETAKAHLDAMRAKGVTVAMGTMEGINMRRAHMQ